MEGKENGKVASRLTGIPETLLIPLWARAEETQRPDGLVRDEKALEMLRSIDYDFAKFRGGWMSQLGIAIRTMILDRETERFLGEHPDAVVINIGCGLDTRSERIGGYAVWYDLDVPQAIALRRRFFSETPQRRMIDCSVFDWEWMDRIRDEGRAVLIIAEGVLMYFEADRVKELFGRLSARFPGAQVLVEMLAPMLVKRNRWHDTARDAPAFVWSLFDSRQMETWNVGIRFWEEWSYFDYCPERWRKFRWVRHVGFLRRAMNNRIVRLSFEK